MAKNQEYVPQFDLNNATDKPNIKYESCSKCGKQSVSLHNGICFDCRKKQENAQGNIQKRNVKNPLVPNEELFNSWKEAKTETATTPFLFRLIWKPFRKYGISAIFVISGISLLVYSISAIFYMAKSQVFNSEVLVLIGIGIALIVGGFVLHKNTKSARHQMFLKFNSTEVRVNESTWTCPSCGMLNSKLEHCERCGVLPTFKQDNLQ